MLCERPWTNCDGLVGFGGFGGYGGGQRWGIHSLVGGFGGLGGFGGCKKHRNRSKRLPNLKVAVLAVPYPFPSICE